MAKTQIKRKDEIARDQPPSLQGRAMENLKFIRETMERSSVFTSVPGYGGIFMGATAIGAAYIASAQPLIHDWLTIWLVEAILAFTIGSFAMWQKAKITNTSLMSVPAKKFAHGFLPPVIWAVFISLGLWRFGYFEIMIPIWILLYGAAVVCGGANSVRIIPVAGWFFIVLGAIAFVLPAGLGNWMMALSFGVLHIVFGTIVARKYGG